MTRRSPIREAVTEVSSVEDKGTLAGFYKVGGDLGDSKGRRAPRVPCSAQAVPAGKDVPGPSRGSRSRRCASLVKSTSLVMRIASPKGCGRWMGAHWRRGPGLESAQQGRGSWGCRSHTSSVTSMGPGMLPGRLDEVRAGEVLQYIHEKPCEGVAGGGVSERVPINGYRLALTYAVPVERTRAVSGRDKEIRESPIPGGRTT